LLSETGFIQTLGIALEGKAVEWQHGAHNPTDASADHDVTGASRTRQKRG